MPGSIPPYRCVDAAPHHEASRAHGLREQRPRLELSGDELLIHPLQASTGRPRTGHADDIGVRLPSPAQDLLQVAGSGNRVALREDEPTAARDGSAFAPLRRDLRGVRCDVQLLGQEVSGEKSRGASASAMPAATISKRSRGRRWRSAKPRTTRSSTPRGSSNETTTVSSGAFDTPVASSSRFRLTLHRQVPQCHRFAPAARRAGLIRSAAQRKESPRVPSQRLPAHRSRPRRRHVDSDVRRSTRAARHQRTLHSGPERRTGCAGARLSPEGGEGKPYPSSSISTAALFCFMHPENFRRDGSRLRARPALRGRQRRLSACAGPPLPGGTGRLLCGSALDGPRTPPSWASPRSGSSSRGAARAAHSPPRSA